MQFVNTNGDDDDHSPFYCCRYCKTLFRKVNPQLFKNIDLCCMFCDRKFSYPPERDYHMCNDHLNEVPKVDCSECGDNFQCIHDKEHHSCIPELGCVQKTFKSPILKHKYTNTYSQQVQPCSLRNLPSTSGKTGEK